MTGIVFEIGVIKPITVCGLALFMSLPDTRVYNFYREKTKKSL